MTSVPRDEKSKWARPQHCPRTRFHALILTPDQNQLGLGLWTGKADHYRGYEKAVASNHQLLGACRHRQLKAAFAWVEQQATLENQNP